MVRPYGGHYLTEEQKKLAGDNFSLVWWYLDKKILQKGKILNHEIDECAGHLIWHFCLCAETFKPEMGIKFSVYAVKALHSGFFRYLQLRDKLAEREVVTPFRFVENGEERSEVGFVEPMYEPDPFSDVEWKDVSWLFDLIPISAFERQIIFFIYEKEYTSKSVGKLVGFTGERVRQIHKNVIDRLKAAVDRNHILIEDFV